MKLQKIEHEVKQRAASGSNKQRQQRPWERCLSSLPHHPPDILVFPTPGTRSAVHYLLHSVYFCAF